MAFLRFESISDGRRFNDTGQEAQRLIDQLTDRLGRRPVVGDEYNDIRITFIGRDWDVERS